MARKAKHEDHVNHEAWAIPYGDLVTLLLAFFVVMYAISSINEGKYRVLADALSEAFGGPPRSMNPIQMGTFQPRVQQLEPGPPMSKAGARGPISPDLVPNLQNRPLTGTASDPAAIRMAESAAMMRAEDAQLQSVSRVVEEALADLMEKGLVTVRRSTLWVEVEIKSDILFASGQAVPQASALPTLEKLAAALAKFPNPLRIEGHTDTVPISTLAFPSNWELSAARAASVVHLFQRNAVLPGRLAVIGYGEQRPREDNRTAEGRNANRRVVLVILSTTTAGQGQEGGMVDQSSVKSSAAGGVGAP